ncbi:type IV secretory system conjugative DNA transfer family protein [Nocardia gipuzkoensis]|uniref:type IV secretory system conjugative DNA transfer family protein n=1 Tax=Nocardia gipuzkoensis TaxID=2749991 RepID=UPI00237E55D3|nr:TraM recognition domain-containing protein [Nocardia gipuzkoensis]MDE1674707.1 TraM recognition domain-containing protein [Nocardia gipuzkoensis]
MDRSVKQPGKNDLSEWKELIAVSAGIGIGEAVGLSMRVGEALYADTPQDISWNPLSLALNLATGHLEWTGADTGGAVTLVAGAAVGVAGSVWGYRKVCVKCRVLAEKLAPRRKIRREAIDSQARYMARGKELAALRREAILGKAQELRVQLREGDAPGVLIARTVTDGEPLYASYEDLHLDIWGPRSGKSTSRVIPAVMEAIGAVVVTSNKRDVVDATRAARSTHGRQSYVFDPQGVAEEPCTWYWDPIAWVLGEDGGAGAQERAAELAGHFAAAGEADKRDAFFDPEGEDLLAALFLACALSKKPITQAFQWVTDIPDKSPIDILIAGGFDLIAGALHDQYYAPPEQRGGVFSTAKKMAACLKYARIRPWVCPPAKGESPRTAFKVEEFVRSRDTLYPLSKEGKGSAGPLVTALCAAVAAAGEAEGVRHPRGRLPVPLLIVLDEAANIVKWADLPKQYSHFGSRGMVVMTILQSWAQGVRCWGHEGMTALWSAANIKVLGAGLDDAAFLRDRSELIGPHYELTDSVSKSHGKGGGRSTSTSRTTETTLHASDLAALPKGRVVIFASGHRPTLGQAVSWQQRPYAAQIHAALDAIGQSDSTEIRPSHEKGETA